MNSVIKKHGKTDPKKVWDYVKTFADLQNANIAFLQGDVAISPYTGLIDVETVPLLGKLIKINANGFVSDCGQPPFIWDGRRFKLWDPVEVDSKGNAEEPTFTEVFRDIRQKSFISGYLPSLFLHAFVLFMKQEKDVYYAVYVTGDHHDVSMIIDTFPHPDFPVTSSRDYETKAGRSKAEWDTSISLPAVQSGYSSFRDLPSAKRVLLDCVYVIVGYKDTSGSVEDVLLRFFKSIRSKRSSMAFHSQIKPDAPARSAEWWEVKPRCKWPSIEALQHDIRNGIECKDSQHRIS